MVMMLLSYCHSEVPILRNKDEEDNNINGLEAKHELLQFSFPARELRRRPNWTKTRLSVSFSFIILLLFLVSVNHQFTTIVTSNYEYTQHHDGYKRSKHKYLQHTR
jgi:hypothetical protein